MLLLFSAGCTFAQTKLIVNRKNGIRDSLAVTSVSQMSFSSSHAGGASILEVVTVLDSAKTKFIEYAGFTKGDLIHTLNLTEYWLMNQPSVLSTLALDDGYIYITFKSGLRGTFYFDTVDDSGKSIYRGASGGSTINSAAEFVAHAPEILSKNVIRNKKVLLFETDISGLVLEPMIDVMMHIFANSGLDLIVTVMKEKQCTPEVVETFGNYGLVIIDGHGQPGAFQLGKSVDFTNAVKTEASVREAINTQLGPGDLAKISSGDIELAASVKGNPQKSDWINTIINEAGNTTWLSGKYIAMLPPMPNTIIFGNMCHSGWVVNSVTMYEKKFTLPNNDVIILPGRTDIIKYPVGKAFIDRDPISYYGYTRNEYLDKNGRLISKGSSRMLPDDFAKTMETIFLNRLTVDKDSTGIANLQSDNRSEYYDPPRAQNIGDLFFRHYVKDDYSYMKCGDTLTDTRDGNKYLTVCIGDQKWMAQNLNYNAPGSITYDNDPVNGPIYGRLYDYNTIMQGAGSSNSVPSGVRGICPQGWHVPSSAEYEALFDAVGFDTAGGAMKSTTLWTDPNTGATNSSGFNGLPGGFTSSIGTPGSSLNLGLMAYFATSTVSNGLWTLWNLVYDGADIQGTDAPLENWGVSCRCVKD